MDNSITTTSSNLNPVTIPGVGAVPQNIATSKYGYSGTGVYNGTGPTVLGNPATAIPNTISSDNLTTSPPLPPPPVNTNTQNTNLGVTASSVAEVAALPSTTPPGTTSTPSITDPATRGYFSNLFKSILKTQAGKGDFVANQQVDQQLFEKQKALTDINNEALVTQRAYDQQIKAARVAPTGGTTLGTETTINDLTRKKNEDLANIGIRQAVAQGNVESATNIINQKVATKFEPLDNVLKTLQAYQAFYGNDLTDKEKVQAQTAITTLKDKTDKIQSIYQTLGQNMANNQDTASMGKLDAAVQTEVDKLRADPNYIPNYSALYTAAGTSGATRQLNIVNANGRQLLVNTATGETVKDLGAAPLNAFSFAGTPAAQALIDAVMSGKQAPKDINSRNMAFLGNLYTKNPDFNGIQANAAATFWESRSTQEKLAWATTTEKDFTTLQSLSDSVKRTDYPLINAALLKGETSIAGNPNATAFLQASNRVAASLSNVLGDSGGSDFRTKLANGVLDPTFSAKTFTTVLDTESKLINNLTTSFREIGNQPLPNNSANAGTIVTAPDGTQVRITD